MQAHLHWSPEVTKTSFTWDKKLLKHKDDHLPPSSAEVKKVWSHTFITLYLFMVQFLI
jgi:hypothetical protein